MLEVGIGGSFSHNFVKNINFQAKQKNWTAQNMYAVPLLKSRPLPTNRFLDMSDRKKLGLNGPS